MGIEEVPGGEFVAGKCDEVAGALSAVRKARSLALEKGGAVVSFRNSGSGEWLRPRRDK
jgi:hypothetical protein